MDSMSGLWRKWKAKVVSVPWRSLYRKIQEMRSAPPRASKEQVRDLSEYALSSTLGTIVTTHSKQYLRAAAYWYTSDPRNFLIQWCLSIVFVLLILGANFKASFPGTPDLVEKGIYTFSILMSIVLLAVVAHTTIQRLTRG